ncbi:MAG: putative selenium-dependent hydroxylase accessory protein YqeC [Caldilineaceae bacterium]|nr:putative selenium-dependent hydroxylase accessory protein YqeC [Caldilineaceae bacterium]
MSVDLTSALLLAPHCATPEVVSFVGGGGKSSAMARLADELTARGRRVVVTTTTHIAERQSNWFGPLIEMRGELVDYALVTTALDTEGKCLIAQATHGGKRMGIKPDQVDALVTAAADLALDAVLIEADGSRGLPVKAPAAHEPVIPDCTTLLVSVLGLDGIGARLDETHVHRPDILRRLLGLPSADLEVRLAPAMVAQLLTDDRGGAKSKPSGARQLCLLNKADNAPRRWMARLVAHRLVEAGYPSVIAALGLEDRERDVERWAPTAAVVLAAGQAQRMGRAKQLVEIDGVTLLERAVRVALQSSAQQVMVVTGAHAESVRPLLLDLQRRADGRLRHAHNPNWASGQASSVAAAIGALSPAFGAAIFLPVDQPFLEPLLLRRLAQGWRQGAQLVAPMVDGEIRGAPALFDRVFWPALNSLTGDVGGKLLLRQHRDAVVAVEADATWLRDIDTPADLDGLNPFLEVQPRGHGPESKLQV